MHLLECNTAPLLSVAYTSQFCALGAHLAIFGQDALTVILFNYVNAAAGSQE
jgi:hypothetical protein